MLQKKGEKVKLEPVEVVIDCSKFRGWELAEQKGIDIGAAAEEKTVVFFQTCPKIGEFHVLVKRNQKRQSAVICGRLYVRKTGKHAPVFSGAHNDTDGRGILFHI